MVDFLSRTSTPDESAQEEQWIEKLEKLRDQASSGSFVPKSEKMAQLQVNRTWASRTIRRNSSSIAKWNEAQLLIQSWLLENREVGLNCLVLLNDTLSEVRNSGWRRGDIFTTQVKHPSPSEVDLLMEELLRYFQQKAQKRHAIFGAFVWRYWLLSIHPFDQANGRTSQLFADFLLMKAGFMPQCFCSELDICLSGDPERKAYMTPHRAFKRFCSTVENSYAILME